MIRNASLVEIAKDTVNRTKDIPCNTSYLQQEVMESIVINRGIKAVKLIVEDSTTYNAMARHKREDEKIGILNFASAKHPGGGFLGGSMAQEESLCYLSNLYHTQLTQPQFYVRSTKEGRGIYSSNIIVSRDVKFIKSEQFELLKEPFNCDVVITSAAVNFGNLNRWTEKSKAEETKAYAESVMEERIRGIIKAFILEGCDVIILGAYGCGVFKNNPYSVARQFRKVLFEEGLGRHFDRIVFAIPKSNKDNNLAIFKDMLR